MKKLKSLFSGLYLTLTFIFLYLPILTLIVFSFNDGKGSRWKGFSLRWYEDLFESRVIMDALSNTLIIALAAALIATVIGTLTCIGINSLKGAPKAVYMALNNIPLLNSDLVTGLSLMLVFITTGLRNESVRELRVRDVDFDLMQIHVSAAKGNKSGNAPLTDIAGVALRAYLNGHPELKADDYLFGWRDDVSGEWKPFSREQLSNTVEAAALSYTGKPSIRTHALRHSCASILAKNGLEDREISLLLFHSDGTGAAVTRRYISDDLSWLYQKVNKIFNRLTAKISLVDRAATY